jgi:hemolysin activation/secretion protein
MNQVEGMTVELHRGGIAALVLGISCLCGAAHAQVSGAPLDRPSERPLPLPKDEPERPSPTIEFPPLNLPPLEMQPDETRSLPRLRVRVRDFQFVGNTAFSAAELASITAPYREREIGSDDLETIRIALTGHYIERGYINSGAVLPDQKVSTGVITYQIVEGRLTGIEVNGMRRLRASYVRDRVALASGQPLNVYAIRDRLFLLQQDPRIQRLDAVLLPGTRPGEATLRVEVTEAPSGEAYFTVNNHRPPSVGAGRGEIALLDYNMLGFGDSLALRAGLTEGSSDVDLSYAVLLNARDTTLNFRYAQSSSNVVEAPFDQLNVESRAQTAGIGISHFLRKGPQEEVGLGLTFEQRESQSFLLGEPFAFSQGTPPDGRVRLSILRFSQSWLKHDSERVIVARSTFSDGIDIFNATINRTSEPDGRFLSWLGQLQWVERLLARRDELVVRVDAQLSKDPLPSLEQLSVGGANSVRGYRENQQVRDSGLFTSIEYRLTVWSDPGRGHRVQLAGFYDRGQSWNRERTTPDPQTLASVGVGVRTLYYPWLEFELYYGKHLTKIEQPGANLQDKGIHFQIRARVW